jgi:hypothetical protein
MQPNDVTLGVYLVCRLLKSPIIEFVPTKQNEIKKGENERNFQIIFLSKMEIWKYVFYSSR